MIDLFISVLLFNILVIFFKLFEKYKIDNLQALITNYIVSFLISCSLIKKDLVFTDFHNQIWFSHALIIGILFISIFNLYAYSTQKIGIALTSVNNKMSFIIPVIASFFIYNDEIFTLNKLVGISLALVGIFLASTKNTGLIFDKKYIWLLIILFLGQGIADIILNDSKLYIGNNDLLTFFLVLFLSASIFGIIIVSIKSIFGTVKIKFKNIIAGIIFGVPNFYSILYFLKALQSPDLISKTSFVFPLTSVAIVVSTTLVGISFYNEKLFLRNYIGILIAIISIFIISY
jgi:drug/metabolite transporter (DMT)-like permease